MSNWLLVTRFRRTKKLYASTAGIATNRPIAVTERGELFWNDEPSTRQLIESKLSVEAQKDPQPVINIRADKTTKYRLVNDVVKVAQAQGMRKVGFITTPPKKGQ